MGFELEKHIREHKIGKFFYAPVDTEINIVAAPDLIMEILSESTKIRNRATKKMLYKKHGVKEYWIADPDEKKIEQFILKSEKPALNNTL